MIHDGGVLIGAIGELQELHEQPFDRSASLLKESRKAGHSSVHGQTDTDTDRQTEIEKHAKNSSMTPFSRYYDYHQYSWCHTLAAGSLPK